jgi:CspA family cold shock protein
VVSGTVKWFDDEEGWGVLTSPTVPGDVFVHVMCIEADGYKVLNDGEEVEFEYEFVPPPDVQDGCSYRATRVVRRP